MHSHHGLSKCIYYHDADDVFQKERKEEVERSTMKGCWRQGLEAHAWQGSWSLELSPRLQIFAWVSPSLLGWATWRHGKCNWGRTPPKSHSRDVMRSRWSHHSATSGIPPGVFRNCWSLSTNGYVWFWQDRNYSSNSLEILNIFQILFDLLTECKELKSLVEHLGVG